MKQHKLDRQLLDRYVAKRAGKSYGLTRQKRGKKKATKKRAKKAPPHAEVQDVLTMLDRRTKVATLLRLQAKVADLIAQKDAEEVAAMQSTLKNLEKFREQADAAAKKVKDAEALLGM